MLSIVRQCDQRRQIQDAVQSFTLTPGPCWHSSPSSLPSTRRDTASRHDLAQLERIDHLFLAPGARLPRHVHRDEEVFTCLRQGALIVEGTADRRETVTVTRPMVVCAGTGVEHEEFLPPDGEPTELLQVCLRPVTPGLPPEVHFTELETQRARHGWRLLAGSSTHNPPLTMRNAARIFDLHLHAEIIPLPCEPEKTYLLYVFDGQVGVSGGANLHKGDALVFADEEIMVCSHQAADLVLLELDEASPGYHGEKWMLTPDTLTD